MSIKLYDFQEQSVKNLLNGKHIIVSDTGCLSAGTPIPMADGKFKLVEALSAGDKIFSYDEHLDKIIENEVEQVIRTCHKPKPMIELEYEEEKITTTYDHPFFNGDGYYPLYQLIWGALEASQRAQLELLCEQYGQAIDYQVERCKHCESNESCKGRKWVLQNGDGRKNNKSAQDSSRELAGQSEQIGMCEPYQLRQSRQQSRESGVVLKKIQRLVGNKTENYESTKEPKQQENAVESRKNFCKGVLHQKYTTKKEQFGKELRVQQTSTNVPRINQRDITNMGNWKIKIKVSEPYYTISMRKAPYTYFIGRKHCFVTHNSGKSFMMFDYLRRKDPKKVLIVATPSKVKSKDFEQDADDLCGVAWRETRTVEIISWYKLYDWVYNKHWKDLDGWTVAFDECMPYETPVITNGGEKKLGDLRIGDKVLSYSHDSNKLEYKAVTKTIRKAAPDKMVRLHLSNGTAIISTSSHPHYTQDGYKEAADIKVGDTLYEMHKLREDDTPRYPDTKSEGQVQEQGKSLLFGKMCKRKFGETSQRILYRQENCQNGRSSALCDLWKKDNDERYEQNAGKLLYPVWESPLFCTMRKNKEQRVCAEGFRNEKEKRVSANMDDTSGIEGWQWELFRTAKKIMEEAKRNKQRLGNGTASQFRQKRTRVSNVLQARYREYILQNRGRVRRRESQFYKSAGERQKESRQIIPVRVEGVEVLELRDIKRYGLYRDSDYVYCIDVEDNHNFFAHGILTHNCHMGSAGISSKRGKAMLMICNRCKDWTGYTATPGDTWIKFYPYFVAAGRVRTKTEFKSKFCIEQRYPFPAILAYRQEDTLKEWWADISYAPDTADIFAQLPEKTYRIVKLDKPKGYDKCLKNSETLEGEFLDSNMAVAHYARQMCSTKAKKDWLSEFLDGLNGNAVIFYNYKKEREDICEVAKKAGYKVWRIDGEKHEIPTPDTIGKKDLVVAHYQSGSNSLNLQFMNYWVSYSYNYSYTTFLQALGRIDRIGQKKPMFFYFLKCKGTIEDDIAKALSSKQDFSAENWCIEKGIDNNAKVC